MRTLYFVSFEVRSVNIKLCDMCQLVLDKPVRSFGDILNMARTIQENYKKNLGECEVVILNYQRLEEETPMPQNNGEEVEQ